MELFDLNGRVALITGATRGIGRGIAEVMAAAGARIAWCSEVAADVATTQAAFQARGFDSLGLTCDITDDARQKILVEQTLARFGRIDALVCNAGITGKPGGFTELELSDYDRVMAINLRPMVVLTQLALPHMARGGGGAVILMASLAALRGNARISSYALAKAGVAQLARNLAVEWGPKNIRANAISPGLINTELSGPLMANKEFMARRMQMTPLRRVGEVHEIAGAALFLASAAGAFITGQNIVVDGGTVITDGS